MSKKPVAPGLILHEKYISPKGWTQKELSDMVDCDVKVINRLVNGRQAVSPLMAVKLARITNTQAEYWLGLQNKVDIFMAEQSLRRTKKR